MNNGESKAFCKSNKKQGAVDEWWLEAITVTKEFSCVDGVDKCFFGISGVASEESCKAAWNNQGAVPLTTYATFPNENPAFTAVRITLSLNRTWKTSYILIG